MKFLLDQLLKLHHDHPAVFVWVFVPLATLVLNGAIFFLTSSRWNQIVLANPRLAGALKMLKAFGIDPVSWLKGVVLLVTGRPWVEPAPSIEEKAAGKLISYRTAPCCSKCGANLIPPSMLSEPVRIVEKAPDAPIPPPKS